MIGQEKSNIIILQEALDFPIDMVGHKAYVFGELHRNSIPTTHGFVVTTNQFNNFLISNDIVSRINELLSQAGLNLDKAIKISGEIEKLFKDSRFTESFGQELEVAYNNLTGSHNKVLRISPSWTDRLNSFNSAVDLRYTFTNITNIEDLKRGILLAWQAIFDPQLIKYRFENGYNGPLTMGLVVQRMPNAEVSGRAYSYNPVNSNFDEIEIESVLGVWRGVDELSITPDRYVVQKENEKIVEKYTTTQPHMLLRKPVFKIGEDIDLTIKVSKPWQVRQKASDQIIKEIALLVKSVQHIINFNEYEIEWVLDTGRVHVVGFRVLSIKQEEQTAQDKTKLINKVEVVKPIDQYVREIENEIEELSKQATPESTEEELSEGVPTIVEGRQLYENIKYSQQKNENKLINSIWIGLNKFPSYEINSSLFDGIVDIDGYQLVEGFGQKITESNKDIFTQYSISQIEKLISQDNSKEFLYSPSLLDVESSMRFLSVPSSGLSSHFQNDILINAEIKAIKDLRDKYGYRKVSLLLKGSNSVEDMAKIKKVVLSVGLRRSSTFRFWIYIDTLPQYLNLKQYIEDSVDGIVLDFDQIWSVMYGNKASEEMILNEKVFWNSFREAIELANSQKVKVVIKNNSIHHSERLLQKLIKLGVSGFVFNWDAIEKGRKAIAKAEVEVLVV
jgi:hypothetical protein